MKENVPEHKLTMQLELLVQGKECPFPQTADFWKNISSISQFLHGKRINYS